MSLGVLDQGDDLVLEEVAATGLGTLEALPFDGHYGLVRESTCWRSALAA